MILGTGNDITDIRRIEKSLKRFGTRFEKRIFTDAEQHKAQKSPTPASTYAKRFAAKEACAKALGSGLNNEVFWRDMEVVSLASGAPSLRLTGGALKRLKSMIPGGMTAYIHLSLSDEYPYAIAHVIISAETKRIQTSSGV
jgi:holo-[acyl-carrier protein] synthase